MSIEKYPVLMGVIGWLRNNFGLPVQMLFDPLGERTGISVISEQVAETRKASVQVIQQDLGPFSVGDPGGMNFDCQHKA